MVERLGAKILGNGKEFRGKAKGQWGKLTNDRVDLIASRRDQLEGEIQQTYRIIRGLSEQQFREFEERNKHSPS